MSNLNTKIEWCDATWSPVTGCVEVSPGCDRCYARTIANRFKGTKAFPNGFAVTLHPERLAEPLSWKKPRRVFVNSMSDLFHRDIPDDFISAVFGVMALTPHLTYQILTKRPERMAHWFASESANLGNIIACMGVTNPETLRKPFDGDTAFGLNERGWPLPNVWLGTSIESQKFAASRLDALARCPAAVRFVSAEPLLGPLDLRQWLPCADCADGPHDDHQDRSAEGVINWVIIGGESGPGARLCDTKWIMSLVAQAKARGVPVFLKQFGAVSVSIPKGSGLRYNVERPAQMAAAVQELGQILDGSHRFKFKDRKGGDWNEWPAELRIREFPTQAKQEATA